MSLMMVPGQRLSLQFHTGCAELWGAIDDGVGIHVGEDKRAYKSGNEIEISVNEKHCLSCRGEPPVRVLEVTFGNWQ